MTKDLEAKLRRLMDIVLAKNKVLNLTSITNPEDFWQKHILDSLEIIKIGSMREILGNYAGIKARVIDIGSGAGFPGLALALAFEGVNFTLIDSTKKKVDAIQRFIQKLKINNATAIWGRSEDLARNKGYFEQYDLVVARSVAYLPKLIEMTADLAKKDGLFAFYKLDNQSELADGMHIAKDFGLKYVEKHAYNLESSPQSRAIYIFQKEV